MNKIMLFAPILLMSIMARGSTITNTVVIVSNYYNNVYHESVVTQKVKNTHINYYFTNNVYTVSNRTFVVSQTNLNVNVINTNFGPWIAQCQAAASNAQAAQSAASSSASSASSYASSASSYASSALSHASIASASASSASAAAQDGINRINQRIQWFDDHSGQAITVINIMTNTSQLIENLYYYVYTSPSGVQYPRLLVYPLNLPGTRVTVLPNSGQYATKNIKLWVNTSNTGSSTISFTMVPSYVDSDANGLRLNYVLDQASREKNVYYRAYVSGNNTDFPNQSVVPQYAYWQNGILYAKFQVWANGSVTRSLVSKLEWSNFPNTINWGTSSGALMNFVSAVNWGYINNGGSQTRYMYVQSETRGSSTSEKVNFPDTLSTSDMISFNWMQYHNIAP